MAKRFVLFRARLVPGAAQLPLYLMLLCTFLGTGRASGQSTDSVAITDENGTSTEPAWLAIHYSGALFGYYRIEPDGTEQELQWGKLGPVKKFLQQDRHDWLLLGMGDNFGPEFGASVQRELRGTSCAQPSTPPRWGHKDVAPEVLYKDENRLPRMAECDNVGRFLMQAGYRVIVPGREDFLYSARWLRRIAVLLQGASNRSRQPRFFPDEGVTEGKPEENSEDRNYHKFISDQVSITGPDNKLLMLAANLRLNFKPEASAPLSGIDKQQIALKVKGACPLLFSWDPLGADSTKTLDAYLPPEACISNGEVGNAGETVTTEMDWLRRLDLIVNLTPNCSPKGDTYDDCIPVAASMNHQAFSDTTFRKQLLINEAKIASAAFNPAPLNSICTDRVNAAQTLDSLALKDVNSLVDSLKNSGKVGPISSSFSSSTDVANPLANLLAAQNEPEGHACRAWAQDIQIVANDLYKRFALRNRTDSMHDATPTVDNSFLFSPPARKASIRLLLRTIAAQQMEVGYTIVRSGAMRGTLVIGVVGPETMKAASPGNLTLCTKWTEKLNEPAHTSDLDLCDDRGDYKGPFARETEEIAATAANGGRQVTKGRLVASIKISDPVLTVTSVLRAAWLVDGPNRFDKVIVMAQMPRTEAEELAARVRSSLNKTRDYAELAQPVAGASLVIPHVDLIISEPQPAHITPSLRIHYRHNSLIPVVTPKPAWYINEEGKGLVEPVSTVTLGDAQQDVLGNQVLTNRTRIENPPLSFPESMAEHLKDQLHRRAPHSPDLDNLNSLWNTCGNTAGPTNKTDVDQATRTCENSVIMQYLLEQMHRSSHADVVLLEYRDFYFGPLLREYRDMDTDYNDIEVCRDWFLTHPNPVEGIQNAQDYCNLRVALDRVLWKGDFSERVMVDGKNLKLMLATAQQETDDEQSLAARDTVSEWLMTFGIVTQLPTNLSAASLGPATFTVPGVSLCKSDGSEDGTSQYCINSQKVTDDGAYWIATSDHLAEDSQLYKVLNNLDASYHLKKRGLFLTGEITDEIYIRGSRGPSQSFASVSDAPAGMRGIETYQQKRAITQLDYAKVVAGFMVRKPDISNTQLGSDYSGVADSRATTPSAQEVDLEAMARMSRGFNAANFAQYLKVGIQSDFEYDRAVTGNVNGSPETVTYALNSFTTGGFLQIRLDGDRPLPRLFLVMAPYQYQQQVTGNYLNFKFTTPPGQITVPTPRWQGFAQRLGGRYEFGGSLTGSYVEGGPEYVETHSVLSTLVLPDGTDCPVRAGSFTSCFTNDKLVITSSTVLKPLTETVKTGGWYWNVHMQKPLGKTKRTSFTVETKGDHYEWPGMTLPTQSHYAFTTTGALNFAVIGNLMFSPTLTTFFYRNQGTLDNPSHSLVTNTFSVTAKWYFARDAAVPFWQQLWFQGPASLDQTKSAKMK
jgi:hypothetical protein